MTRLLLSIALFIVTPLIYADILFSESFDYGDTQGWKVLGRGDHITSIYLGDFSYRLSQQKNATYILPTKGRKKLNIKIEATAVDLESKDQCVGEVSINEGISWIPVITIIDGNDDGVTMFSKTLSLELSKDSHDLWIRLRANGTNDHQGTIKPRRPDFDLCWFDDITVTSDN